MAKSKVKYVCQNCGAEFPKWYGKCPSCGAWNTIVEEPVESESKVRKTSDYSTRGVVSHKKVYKISEIKKLSFERIKTGILEFDRVLGGGFVPGSIVLLAGEPGVGKSTLALQVAFSVSKPVIYVSGEESLEQIKLRTERLSLEGEQVFFVSETVLEDILAIVESQHPKLVIIDSIQTTQSELLDSAPGSVSQIRECASAIQRFAKSKGIAFLLIGHITKEGLIAGPKVLEHIVDTVLQFEGDTHYVYRIVRAIKNRFGSTSELGIFEMTSSGLVEVSNPSTLWLSPSEEAVSGVAIGVSLEGMRPLLIEVQALVTNSAYGTPQRAAIGFDYKRLNMLLAVLEKRLGLRLGVKDIFLNIAGGLKVDDPAIDLAVVASLISSYLDKPIGKNIGFCGEVSLTGEVRPVQNVVKRILELEKLGFKQVLISKYEKNLSQILSKSTIEVKPISKVSELFAFINYTQ